MKNLTIGEQKIRAKASVAKMHIEELGTAIKSLDRISSSLFIFAGVLLFSTLIFGARDWPFIIISTISGLIILLIKGKINWNNKINIIISLALFIGVTIIEWFLFGLPDELIANLEYGPRIVVIFNALSPLLYPGLKLVLAIPFFSILNFKNKVAAHPKEVLLYLQKNDKIPKNLQYLMPNIKAVEF